MKVIIEYEQGDIVYNNNNENYGIVIQDKGDAVIILELNSEGFFFNKPPKRALKYVSKMNLGACMWKHIKEEDER